MTEIHLDLAETTVAGAGSRPWSLTRDDRPELREPGRSPKGDRD